MFGPAAVVRANINPPARTWHSFPGLNGRFTKSLGLRACRAVAQGVLTAGDEDELAILQAVFDSYLVDGGEYVLTDSLGTTWPYMILVSFERSNAVLRDYDGVSQEYVAQFESTRNSPP